MRVQNNERFNGLKIINKNEDHMRSYSPLTTAIIAGDENEVKNLLEKKVDVNAAEKDGISPLMFAAIYQNLNMVRMLLEYKADVNYINCINDDSDRGRSSTMTKETTLSVAIMNGDNTEIVNLLLEHNADMNAATKPALNLAAFNDRKKIAKLLLKKYKVDINSTDKYGNSALMNAAARGSLATVKALLKFENIHIHHKNHFRLTARDRATEEEHNEIIGEIDRAIFFRKEQEKLNFEIQAAYQRGIDDFTNGRYDDAIDEFGTCIMQPNISDDDLIRSIDHAEQNITCKQAALNELAPIIIDAYLQRSIAYCRLNKMFFCMVDFLNFIEFGTKRYNKTELQDHIKSVDEKMLVTFFKDPVCYEKLKPYLSFSQRFAACGVNAVPEMLQNFIDPITTTIINDPIAVSSGQTYDRQSLIKYFAAHGNASSLPDPMTKEPINYRELKNKTNIAIKNTIELLISELEQSQRSRLVLEKQQSQKIRKEKRTRRPSFTEEMKQQNEMRKEERDLAQQTTTISSSANTSYIP